MQPVVLWDVDGVLIDSEPLHVEKLIATTAKYGVQLREDDFMREHDFQIPDGKGGMKDVTMPLHGAGDTNIYYWTIAQKPELAQTLTIQSWYDQLLEHYLLNKTALKPRDGMVKLVNRLDAAGIIQGVVTSGIPAQVDANLEALGPAALKFAFRLTADDVTRNKPDPQGYLIGVMRAQQVLKFRNENPVDAFPIAIEDSPNGVRAALSAGIACVQFLLPGQSAFHVENEFEHKFRVAHRGQDVLPRIDELFTLAQKIAQNPDFKPSPNMPNSQGKNHIPHFGIS